MCRFYLPPDRCQSDSLTLSGREAHHARHVLRLERGDEVTVLDGAGNEFACEIQDSDRDSLRLEIVRRGSVPVPPWQITLLQAVPKGKLFESIIQKTTELGVSRIVPLLSEHSVSRLDGTSAAQKAEKWQRTAIEAIKQCGSAWLPKVEPPVSPGDFLARKEKFDLALIASLQIGSRHAREYFHEYRTRHGRLPQSLCIWVGPEGDFTPEEIAAAETAGALPITLGRLVLRAETAAISSLAILNYELESASSA
jgi:16S rRNA (uracil1498-N3)-methyltransferase